MIRASLKSELDSRLFIGIKPELRKYIGEERDRWRPTKDAFPDAKIEMLEAGGCLAFERPMAAVFHLMRIAEYGVRGIGLTLNLGQKPIEDMTWGEILSPCESELAKKPAQRVNAWATDANFFRDVVMNLRSLKQAVRDPTMHVRKEYTVESAEHVYAVTRAFIVHAAERLHYP